MRVNSQGNKQGITGIRKFLEIPGNCTHFFGRFEGVRDIKIQGQEALENKSVYTPEDLNLPILVLINSATTQASDF